MSAIHNFFHRFLPEAPLRVVANVRDALRIRNILEDIEGVYCRIEKPIDREGKGWKIIVDGSSDIEPPEDILPPWGSSLTPYDSPAPEPPVDGGDNGTSDEYARGDHAHPLEMPDPSGVSDGTMLIADGGSWTTLGLPAGPAVLAYDATSGVRWQVIDAAKKGVYRNDSDQINDDYLRAF